MDVVRAASREKSSEDAGVVEAEVKVLAGFGLDHQEMAEVAADGLEWLVTSEVDAPAVAPTVPD